MIRIKKAITNPHTLFVILSLLILGRGLGSGYLFLLDMPWPEQFDLSNYTENGIQAHYPITVLLWALSSVVPSWAVQKLVFVVILSMCGLGVFRLSKYLGHSTKLALTSGTLALINPYVTERLYAGQWLVLSGYAMTAFVIHELLVLLQKRDRKSMVRFSLMYAIFPIVSVHWWYIATPLLVVIALLRTHQDKSSFKQLLKSVLPAIVAFVVINSFWLLSFSSNNVVQDFSSNDFTVFQTRADDSAGLELTVATQYGFWNDRVSLPKDISNTWLVYGLGSLLLATTGIVLTLKSKSKKDRGIRLLAKTFALVTPIAYLLSLGYGHTVGKIAVDIARIFPGFDGLRETAKIIGIISLFVALFAPLGLQKVFSNPSARIAGWSVFAVLAVLSMGSFVVGSSPRLATYQYPQGYHDVRELSEKIDSPILALPWSSYLEMDFAGNAYTVNPATVYFSSHVQTARISGNNLLDTRSDFDTQVLRVPDQQWVGAMRESGFSHVIILKTDSWKSYSPLLSQGEVLYDSDEIALIKL